ncbi:hypothetical protein J6P68_04710 [bacterium]|nr:hypothetical protein [bacterium]
MLLIPFSSLMLVKELFLCEVKVMLAPIILDITKVEVKAIKPIHLFFMIIIPFLKKVLK